MNKNKTWLHSVETGEFATTPALMRHSDQDPHMYSCKPMVSFRFNHPGRLISKIDTWTWLFGCGPVTSYAHEVSLYARFLS